MTKVCIIAPANLKYIPFAEYYIEYLKKANIEFDVISWDKAGIDEGVKYRFNYIVNDLKRAKMLFGYLRFTRYCKKIIKREKYTKLIFLTIAPLFFCGMRLSKRYRKNYILDIRDASPLTSAFPKTFKKLLDNSFCVVSSSWMYSSWIKHDTILSHNIDINQILLHYNDSVVCKNSEKKMIVFAGMMIEEKMNIEVVKQFKNSDNLMFLFIGRENDGKIKLMEHVKQDSYDNVYFEGTYKKEDIVNIYRDKADFVNILRENTEVNKNAIPNKFYDSIVSGVPLVVFSHNDGIAQVTKEYNLGVVIDEESLPQLYDLLESFDYQNYQKGRKEFMDKVLMDDKIFKESLKKFLKE